MARTFVSVKAAIFLDIKCRTELSCGRGRVASGERCAVCASRATIRRVERHFRTVPTGGRVVLGSSMSIGNREFWTENPGARYEKPGVETRPV